MHRPMPRPTKPTWYGEHARSYQNAIAEQAKVVLLGDSLVANLARYPAVWDNHLAPLHVVNCGIGGDRTQNVFWRIEKMYLPGTVAVGVIHCGINDIKDPSAHAYGPCENVILCGSKLKERNPSISIIIMGILHAAETFRDRNSRIEQVNVLLKQSCSTHGFLYVEQASCWRDLNSGDINPSLYWRDGLHLNKHGCEMLASLYSNNIKTALTSQSQPEPPPNFCSKTYVKLDYNDRCSYFHIQPHPTVYNPPTENYQ